MLGFGWGFARIILLDTQALDVELIDAGGGATIIGIAALSNTSIGRMVGIAPLFGGRRCAEHARCLLTVLKGVGQVPTHGSVGDDKRLVVAGGADVGGIDVTRLMLSASSGAAANFALE